MMELPDKTIDEVDTEELGIATDEQVEEQRRMAAESMINLAATAIFADMVQEGLITLKEYDEYTQWVADKDHEEGIGI